MAKVHYDFETIFKGLNQAEEALEMLLKDAEMLNREVEEAQARLMDWVDKKDIDALRKLVFVVSSEANYVYCLIRELQELAHKIYIENIP